MLCMDNAPVIEREQHEVHALVKYTCAKYIGMPLSNHTTASIQGAVSLALTEAGWDSRRNIDVFIEAGTIIADLSKPPR